MKTYNTNGGGAKTNETGLTFEEKISLERILTENGFKIKNTKVFLHDALIGYTLKKKEMEKYLKENIPNWENPLSKNLEPDECFLNLITQEVCIIEKKFQLGDDSVDEKLFTIQSRRDRFEEMFEETDFDIRIIYVLNNWFKQAQYADHIKAILKAKGKYFFETLPLESLGISFNNIGDIRIFKTEEKEYSKEELKEIHRQIKNNGYKLTSEEKRKIKEMIPQDADIEIEKILKRKQNKT